MTIYGHRQLNIFFRPLIEIMGDGFKYSGRTYAWNDIKRIDSDYDHGNNNWFYGVPSGIPKAVIELKDGTLFELNSRILERKGEKPTIGFLSNKSDVYEELVRLLKDKSG